MNDEMFGQGFARGVVAVTGGSFNVLIDWRQRRDADGSPKPASRGTVHLTRSGVITQKTPQLFKSSTIALFGLTRARGRASSFDESVRLNSWVILKAKPQGGGS